MRIVWGLTAPLAIMAAQVHQESSWRPDARSSDATGLAQFTPATADWISQKYPDLKANTPFEPGWAFRALARYDLFLYSRQAAAETDCDRWAFTLSAYNGGEGWVRRDQELAARDGLNARRWWNAVERRSDRSPAAFQENRAYPRLILLSLQQLYFTWGTGTECATS